MDVSFNQKIADLLRQMADVLEQQQANPYRINAYRRGAETVNALDRDVRELLQSEGTAGLLRLPFIGSGLASSISEVITTGRWAQLERLRGTLDAEHLLQTVPGIGPTLARAIHDDLHVDTLEALEIAAHDGRLAEVAGIGVRRAAAIRASVANLLGRRTLPVRKSGTPDIPTLLWVDREYRTRARSGKLRKIAPRRFNPSGEAWLPVLHVERGGWHFTALFSNTARAHELDMTSDWVVIYFYDGDHHEGQCTVVTETRGPLQGRRVVRGREAESRRYYGNDPGLATHARPAKPAAAPKRSARKKAACRPTHS